MLMLKDLFQTPIVSRAPACCQNGVGCFRAQHNACDCCMLTNVVLTLHHCKTVDILDARLCGAKSNRLQFNSHISNSRYGAGLVVLINARLHITFEGDMKSSAYPSLIREFFGPEHGLAVLSSCSENEDRCAESTGRVERLTGTAYLEIVNRLMREAKHFRTLQ